VAGAACVGLAAVLTTVIVKYAPPPSALGPLCEKAVAALVQTTALAGLRLEALNVEGRDRTSPEDIIAALNVGRGSPILTIDVAEARAAIESLPWVKAARVERQLPNTLHVTIEERRPYALWQHGNRYTLVDREGTPIVTVPDADPGMRVIVGRDAPAHAAALFTEMDKAPDLAARVRAAVRVSGRRWNIYFDSFENGIAVRLPENDMAASWARLVQLEHEHKILERDISIIDLRLPDRLVVRLRKSATEIPRQSSQTFLPAVIRKDDEPKHT
jgi:cell division protein FtsQ